MDLAWCPRISDSACWILCLHPVNFAAGREPLLPHPSQEDLAVSSASSAASSEAALPTSEHRGNQPDWSANVNSNGKRLNFCGDCECETAGRANRGERCARTSCSRGEAGGVCLSALVRVGDLAALLTVRYPDFSNSCKAARTRMMLQCRLSSCGHASDANRKSRNDDLSFARAVLNE